MRLFRPLRSVLLALALLLPPAAAGAQVAEVVSVGMTVADADRSVAFSEEVLDFQKVSDRGLLLRDPDGHAVLLTPTERGPR